MRSSDPPGILQNGNQVLIAGLQRVQEGEELLLAAIDTEKKQGARDESAYDRGVEVFREGLKKVNGAIDQLTTLIVQARREDR
jgi:hypothetical protein